MDTCDSFERREGGYTYGCHPLFEAENFTQSKVPFKYSRKICQCGNITLGKRGIKEIQIYFTMATNIIFKTKSSKRNPKSFKIS
jgi:hypothetical protein